MTTLNKAQLVSVGHSLPALMEIMEADTITLSLSHHIIKGEPRVTLDPKGNTISLIHPEHGQVDIFSHTYNNFTPHNFVALDF